MRAGERLVRRAHDRVRERGIESPRFLMREGSGLLDPEDRVDKGGERGEVGDREVAARPLGLDAVQRPDRHRQLSQRITLDAGRPRRPRRPRRVRPFGHGAVRLQPGIAHT